jgi:hypothetical protein
VTQTRHPLIELVYNDETGRYLGMLERKLVLMTLENIRFRALLERLTGDMWDDIDFRAEDAEIHEIAIDALQRRLQMSHEEARKLVDRRWEAANPPAPDPSLATFMVGVPKEVHPPIIVPHAKQIGFDHKKHLAGLEKSKANRESASD